MLLHVKETLKLKMNKMCSSDKLWSEINFKTLVILFFSRIC